MLGPNFDVVVLTTYGDEEERQDLRANNQRYPELLHHVRGERERFVVDIKSRHYWRAEDFFNKVHVSKFKIIE